MPHLIIEYSSNVAATVREEQLVKRGHNIMIAAGLFTSSDIKSRGHEVQEFQVGEKEASGSFVHAEVKLLVGRTVEQREPLARDLFKLLSAAFPAETSVTVEITEMNRETYKKRQA